QPDELVEVARRPGERAERVLGVVEAAAGSAGPAFGVVPQLTERAGSDRLAAQGREDDAVLVQFRRAHRVPTFKAPSPRRHRAAWRYEATLFFSVFTPSARRHVRHELAQPISHGTLTEV